MSLNEIQLTNQLLTSLYPDVLIGSTVASTVPAPQPVKYLGKNAKNIALVVNSPTHPFLADEELSFLTNILSACKLSLADVAIINFHSIGEAGIEAAVDLLQPKSVILFGITPLSINLPINFPQFQLQQFNKRTYLSSPELTELARDKALKIQLWNCLKNLFNL